MISALISRLVILIFGTLYPAYSSYKAVKTKDFKLYLKWMMYWIVFALFTAIETFTDIFFSFWFPFYYELKLILVIWLLSPVTKGSSIMYRKVIHPLFMRREQEIDELISKAKDQGYNVILDIGCKGMTLATNAIINSAVKNAPSVSESSKSKFCAENNEIDYTDSWDEVGAFKNMEYLTSETIKKSTIMLSETEDEYQISCKKPRRTRKKDSSEPNTRVTRSKRRIS